MTNEYKRTHAEESDCSDFARRLEGDEIEGHYIMNDDGSVREVYNFREWAKWFETANRTIEKTTIGEVKVSTVFLGLDHRFGNGRPMLFETMIFGGQLDQEMDRYHTIDEARAGHKAMVERVKVANDRGTD